MKVGLGFLLNRSSPARVWYTAEANEMSISEWVTRLLEEASTDD